MTNLALCISCGLKFEIKNVPFFEFCPSCTELANKVEDSTTTEAKGRMI